ncbi:MAG: hypothetical protein PUJ21_02010 [Clostridia bacterium]|nr:hypothetical protein [Clostridia bacterium]MDY6184570.1 hypothetical protein [Eubacteriales bacterium]
MTIQEKAAYLKGLAEGVKLDENTAEGKVLTKVLDLLSDLAAEATDLREYVEELDEDLGDVESELWGDEDDEDEDEDDDTAFYETQCPKCGETVCFDDSIDPEEVVCPACGETFSCDIACDGDCDDCAESDHCEIADKD